MYVMYCCYVTYDLYDNQISLRAYRRQSLKIALKHVLIFSVSYSVNITSIGCWYDIDSSRPIPSLEGLDPLLQDSYTSRKDAIEKCALAANKRGYKVFALKYGGLCSSSPTAHKSFYRFGTYSGCASNGRGGDSANHVYVIGGMKGMFAFSIHFNWRIN